jgi:hypothetical protein
MGKYITVDEFMHAMDEKQKEQVTLLRAIITGTHPELMEHIKWNSPSYLLNGDDRITFSVRPKYPIAVVLHMGATRPEDKNGKPVMDDPSGLIEWKSDTRGAVLFAGLGDIQEKRSQLADIVDRWLKLDTAVVKP